MLIDLFSLFIVSNLYIGCNKKIKVTEYNIKDLYNNGITGLERIDLVKSTLNELWLEGVNLRDSDLSFSSLHNCILDNAFLSKTKFISANLKKANLEKAYLWKSNLKYAILTFANLEYTNLYNANLFYADLRNSNLKNTILAYSDLRNADLRNADLRNAYLRYADLRNADLRNADLRNADLSDADLTNAKLKGANLKGAMMEQNRSLKGPVKYPFNPTLEEENEKYLTILFHHPDTSKIRKKKKGVNDMLDKEKKAFEYLVSSNYLLYMPMHDNPRIPIDKYLKGERNWWKK